MQVGCETHDGLLIAHSEAETCQVCEGKIVQEKCPLCGHMPVYQESVKSGATKKYYCHSCNRGFDTI